jgi:aconitase A
MRRADGIHAARLPTPSVLSTMARMGTLGLLVRLGFALDGETCLSCFGNEMM